jgi:hypothetical protein
MEQVSIGKSITKRRTIIMIKTAKELATAAENVAKNYKTLYVMGCFGWPMTSTMKARAKKEQSYNRKADRVAKIDAADAKTFGFDCVNLIKALLWGWTGDATKNYGGATYGSNNVPDINDGQMIKVCSEVSTDFSNIQVGELLWLEGHVGIYIGNGLAVESTPSWKDGVQITAVHNIGKKSGYNGRSWTKHGKLPYVSYPAEAKPVADVATVKLSVLKKGAKGNQVKALQVLLIGYGYSCGSSGVDGSFGSATDSAVRAYQKANGLAVDGSCGPATWKKLLGAS